MKMKTLVFGTIMIFGTGTLFAQDMPESQVPSVIVNNFKKNFPKAHDVEWEKKGDQFNVEFEMGWSTDYEAWFTDNGDLIKYTEEISNGNLPNAVKNAIKIQYKGFRIDDAKKIMEDGKETYRVEIEKGNDERKLMFTKVAGSI